jgi:hypothetical protein
MTEPKKPSTADDDLAEETLADLDSPDAESVRGGAVYSRNCDTLSVYCY